MKDQVELTMLMPCLNEEKTIGACIREAKSCLDELGCSGEILVSDNGSRDRSADIAKSLGARVVSCKEKGYGNALRCGIRQARGTYIIMADCDMSYDFGAAGPFYEKLRQGCDLVIGNRFASPPKKEAMPFSHRYIGVPFLSWVGRVRYRCDVKDFHCGLRGIRKASMEQLNLQAEGMEFATEMIGKAAAAGLRIGQVPVILRPDGRDGRPHLRTIRDGMRHLIFLLRPLKGIK